MDNKKCNHLGISFFFNVQQNVANNSHLWINAMFETRLIAMRKKREEFFGKETGNGMKYL